MNRNIKYILLFIILGGVAIWLSNFPKKAPVPAPSPSPNSGSLSLSQATTTLESVGQVEGASVSESGVYKHENPNFEFQVPEGYTLGRMEEGEDGEALMIQSASGTVAQVFIGPYTADATLTPEQISVEQPELEMLNTKPYTVGVITGVYFENHIDQGWNIMNIWFNKNNHLFQATAYLENKQQLEAVLNSWKWLPE